MFKNMTFEKTLLVIIIVLFLGQGIYYKIKSDRQEGKIDDLKVEMKVLEEAKYTLAQTDIDKIVSIFNENLTEYKEDILTHTDKAIASFKKANAISYETNVPIEECQDNLDKCDEQNSHLLDTVEEKTATNVALGKALDVSEKLTSEKTNKFNICTNQLNKFKEDWKKDEEIERKLKKQLSFWKTTGQIGIGAIMTAILISVFK